MKEEFEDTKGVIRIRIPSNNRQHNDQNKKIQKDKERSTKHTYKTGDRVTRTPLKHWDIRIIEEEQTTQWPKEKVQKDTQRSTKHTYKTKDRVTLTQPFSWYFTNR